MNKPEPTDKLKATGSQKGIFDLSDAAGVNESERLLMRLCCKSFLSLWAYANLHTAQDMRNGRGSAKEFADVLVVFGSDVIVFSDKHIEYQRDRPEKIAWPRWFKRAIVESAKQLHGAMNWLRRFPDRIFLDAACTRPLPIALPPPSGAKYHLVAVTRGSREACLAAFPGSFGTLQINTSVEGTASEHWPFTIGLLDRSKHFVHVLDEFSLEVVMDEMNTITDFVEYLNARESFLGKAGITVVAAGEEQLAAAYVLNGNASKHPFLPDRVNPPSPGLFIFDESHYPTLKKHRDYQQKKQQDQRSRVWDDLIEKFIHLGDPALTHPGFEQPNHETEKALRIMAAEPRFRRGLLVEALGEMLAFAMQQPGQRRARLFTTREQRNLVYVFLAVPKLTNESFSEYRRGRVAILHAYCRVAKLRFPESTTFVALGIDHPAKKYKQTSEDLIMFTCDEYTPEQKAEAERFQRETGILGENLVVAEGFAPEFPVISNAHPQRSPEKNHRFKRVRREKKRKEKLATAARRRNRL
ncbi:hypothetical protein HCX48_13025 [Rhodocyclus tenuis]|uniref:Uncharacterized protein n=1 Tax=Rhodocyclus gracilis TaxID=2929842 RepID=A0ABX0WN45_9RHOO|nr:hypothetical protein [Rhodocyclus gracilis]NJA90136.1 hypothetical protein [Rhodocyclus gracilis]